MRLSELGARLQVELPLPTVTLGGSLDATFPPDGFVVGQIEGEANFTLDGYVPPHPAELDGFVFGDVTRVASRFVVDPAGLRIRLLQATLTAGAFALKGDGEVRLAENGPRLVLSLSGTLPCTALVSAAAETRLGAALGKVTGKAARATLSGGVSIHVSVQADLSNLAAARALKTITPGCGLRPLTLKELLLLGELLPEALDPKVTKDLEKLLKTPLPAFPALGADTTLNLPKLPNLPLQLPLVNDATSPPPATTSAKAPATATPRAAPKPSAARSP
jgi:hypothetical protein